MGHRDTVFPDGEAARRPFTVDGDIAYGPGVADMKAGLVMNAFVLAAFKRFGGSPYPLTGLYTSDEEIASPSSRPVIENEARRSEEHTSELQSLMRTSYAVFCLKTKTHHKTT